MKEVVAVLDHPYIQPKSMNLEDGEVYIVLCKSIKEYEDFEVSVASDQLHEDWTLEESGTRVIKVYTLKAREQFVDEDMAAAGEGGDI